MKRLAALGLVFVLMFSFTGCKGDIELNKEDNDHVAEYIAGVLLKYSYENEWEYQKLKNSALTNYQNSVSGSTQTSSGNTKANSGSKNTASTFGKYITDRFCGYIAVWSGSYGTVCICIRS
ncbi:MAG: hypothetical protein V8S18_04695 [Lachnospira sp.]